MDYYKYTPESRRRKLPEGRLVRSNINNDKHMEVAPSTFQVVLLFDDFSSDHHRSTHMLGLQDLFMCFFRSDRGNMK